MSFLKKSLDVLSFGFGVLMQEVHEFIIFEFNFSELFEEFLLAAIFKRCQLTELLSLWILVGFEFVESMLKTLYLFSGAHQVQVQFVILF